MIAEGQPQLEIRRHDIARETVPEGPWDLIHERLVLLHLPERLEVLDRLVAALAPSGWLLIEDFDDVAMPTIDRTGVHHDLIAKDRTAFTELLRQRGALPDFGANALRHLKERGLVDTGASGHVVIDVGGSPFARVLAASAALLHDPLLASGITPDEYDRYMAALDDPDFIVRSPEMISAWGRRQPS
jgi:trans-aconitate methyltransferase